METSNQTLAVNKTLKCQNCGASLQFAPGTHTLTCDYCDTVNEIPRQAEIISSYSYEAFIAGNDTSAQQLQQVLVKCNNCGASVDLPPAVTSASCIFCASPLVVAHAESVSVLKPHYVLPFVIDEGRAHELFIEWINSLWFAPSDLVNKVKDASIKQLQGIYSGIL